MTAGEPIVLNDATVVDPISRPGWYVLARGNDGRWYVIGNRVHRDHAELTWFNTTGMGRERLFVLVVAGARPHIVRRSTV